MTVLFRDLVAMLTGNRQPIVRASSIHLAANHPGLIDKGLIDPRTGLKVPGAPIGTCGRNGIGGAMYWTPVEVFKAFGINTHCNVFGEVGERKSSSVKGEIPINAELGFSSLMVDIKGEYSEKLHERHEPLVNFIPGGKVASFGGDQSLMINMLDNLLARESQHEMAQHVVISALGTNRFYLHTVERDMLWYGMAEAHRRAEQPILSHLIEAIDDPTPEMVEEVVGKRSSKEEAVHEFEQAAKELRSTLKRLDTGNLRGMFHGTTTPGLFDVVPFLVMNCRRLTEEQKRVMVVMLNFFVYDITMSAKNGGKKFDTIYHEEAWELVKIPTYLESMVRLMKLGNSEGISSKLISHHPSNLYGPNNREMVDSLLADAGTNVCFRLDKTEAQDYASRLRLNEVELDVVINDLKKGEALYKVGDLPGIRVQHTVTNHPRLKPYRETRDRLTG